MQTSGSTTAVHSRERGDSGRARRTALAAALAWISVFACSGRPPDPAPQRERFAELVATLSGPGGYFDTDNLISNERSYLKAVTDLKTLGVRGGAYLGVGPDQNFSYIAEIRPEVAFIVDVRRDAVLQHLMFKALFEEAGSRIEYLALLFGRPVPADPSPWAQAEPDSLLAYLDRSPPEERSVASARGRVDRAVRTFGMPLDEADLRAIDRFHSEFIRFGPDLRFRSHGRRPRFYYPTYRELLLETDREGVKTSYVATADRFEIVRRLQRQNRIIPVVGDLAGGHALRAIGAHLKETGLEVSAFYTSNVEFYLFGEPTFSRWIENLAALPLSSRSVIIRSVFHSLRGPHPRAEPGYYSTQILQGAQRLVERWTDGSYRTYWDVVTSDILGG